MMYFSPMLLGTAPMPFNDGNFVAEPKIDGHRLLFSREHGRSELWTRHKTLVTERYPELLNLQLKENFCLDGEVCLSDPSGRIQFEMIMERFALKKTEKISRAALHQPVNYIVWDLPYYKKDLRKLPLIERRHILEQILPPHPTIRIVPQTDGSNAEALYQLVEQNKLEGMVQKHKHSIFEERRSQKWLKVIRWEYAQTIVLGYDRTKFGWLLGVEEQGRYRAAGVLKFGTTPAQRKWFYAQTKKLTTGTDKHFVYLEPQIKAFVKFRNWTRNNMLRDPSLIDIS